MRRNRRVAARNNFRGVQPIGFVVPNKVLESTKFSDDKKSDLIPNSTTQVVADNKI